MPPKKAAPPPVAPAPSDDPNSDPTLNPAGPSDPPTAGPGRGRKKQSDVGGAPTEIQLGIDEYTMPRMMSVRLAKGVLPPQTLIHKDAATAMQYSTSLFLNHIANSANEHTLSAGRKNISPQDILAGMRDTEWEFLVPQLEEELAIYVRSVNDKRNEYRRRLKERDSGVGAATGGKDGADGDGDEEMDEAGGEGGDGNGNGQGGRSAKRARLSEGATMDESGLMEEDGHDEEGDEMMEEDEAEQENGEEGSDDDDDDPEAYGSAAEALDSDEPGDASEKADEGSEDEGDSD